MTCGVCIGVQDLLIFVWLRRSQAGRFTLHGLRLTALRRRMADIIDRLLAFSATLANEEEDLLREAAGRIGFLERTSTWLPDATAREALSESNTQLRAEFSALQERNRGLEDLIRRHDATFKDVFNEKVAVEEQLTQLRGELQEAEKTVTYYRDRTGCLKCHHGIGYHETVPDTCTVMGCDCKAYVSAPEYIARLIEVLQAREREVGDATKKYEQASASLKYAWDLLDAIRSECGRMIPDTEALANIKRRLKSPPSALSDVKAERKEKG